jgi:hypothetical protein
MFFRGRMSGYGSLQSRAHGHVPYRIRFDQDQEFLDRILAFHAAEYACANEFT